MGSKVRRLIGAWALAMASIAPAGAAMLLLGFGLLGLTLRRHRPALRAA